ncbi:hypothetical protein [Noviherbaspirillum sp.]|uniref:hypothetical protein n=1 Tax=Noviherbaspirillum sp. TaxID=1926288 RepID=UPI002DDD134A|nr:hypothetical protein [Noviherbaspirillum sp.]
MYYQVVCEAFCRKSANAAGLLNINEQQELPMDPLTLNSSFNREQVMGNASSDPYSHSAYAATFDEKCRLLAGRIAIVTAGVVFIAGYAYGIAEYGVFLGIALGWLPCGIASWLTAKVVSTAAHHVLRRVLPSSRQSASPPIIKPGVQHK